MSRNPNWKEEELTVVLELYHAKGYEWQGNINDSTEEIVVLSSILSSFDLFDELGGRINRSVGSVRMKLANFKTLDPNYNV